MRFSPRGAFGATRGLAVGVLIACGLAAVLSGCASGCSEDPAASPQATRDPFFVRSGALGESVEARGPRIAARESLVMEPVPTLRARLREPDDSSFVLYLDAEPDEGGAPLEVAFVAETDGGRGDASYTWNFGDGNTQDGGHLATHTYEEPGEYEATLTVHMAGASEIETVDIDVTPDAFDVLMECDPDAGEVPLKVHFEAEVVDDITGPFEVFWEFGDGGSDYGNPTTHIYRDVGDYIAKLTVTNAAGQKGFEEFEINVEEPDED